jgi:hypothetical protein
VVLLRLVDCTTPCIVKVYHSCYEVQQCLTEVLATIRWLSAAEKRQVKDLWRHRWDQLHSDYHGAGYVLDPEYLLIGTTDATEQMDGLMNVIEKL